MSGYPRVVRVEPAATTILAGAPVSSIATWVPLGAAANWLHGCGAQIIPAMATRLSSCEMAGGATGVFRFSIAPRLNAIERIWAFQLVGRTSESGAEAEVWPDAEAHQTVSVPNSGLVNPPQYYRQILAAQSATPTTCSFSVKASKTQYVTALAISCFEQWRPVIAAGTTDYGVNEQSLRPRQPISVGAAGTTESVGGVYASLLNADARRSGIFYWAVPDTAPVTRTGVYTSVPKLGMPVLMRKLTSGATTGTVYWSAYAKVDFGNGDVQITTSHSAVSDAVNVVATAYAWTTARAISIDCEDLTATDGRRAASWDELDINIRGNAGGTLSLAAVSIWEQ